MVSTGDTAPDVSATVGTSAHEPFDLVSDTRGDALRAYGVETDVPEMGRYGIAKRAVFVIDADGEVVYDWVGDELADEPDYEAVVAAVEEL